MKPLGLVWALMVLLLAAPLGAQDAEEAPEPPAQDDAAEPAAVQTDGDGAGEPADAPETDSEPAALAATAALPWPASTAWREEPFLGGKSLAPVPPAERAVTLDGAIARTPASTDALVELADVRRQLGRSGEARELLGRVTSLAKTPADRAAALRLTAQFHREQNEPAPEAVALRERLALLPASERRPLHDFLIELARLYRPAGVDLASLLRERAESDPSDAPAAEAWLAHLAANGPAGEALVALDGAAARFPSRRRQLLRLRTAILVREKRPGEARDAYLAASLPKAGGEFDFELLDDLVALLRERRELPAFRRELEARSRAGRLRASETAALVWILSGQNRSAEALALLDVAAIRRDALGQLEARLGRPGRAAKLFLGEFLGAKEPATRESALAHLAGVLGQQPAVLPLLASDAAGVLLSPGRVESNPGAVGGLLSLVFNSTSPHRQLVGLRTAVQKFEGQGVLLEISRVFDREFPDSSRGHALFLAALEPLMRAGEHALVARWIGDRLTAHPGTPAEGLELGLRRASSLLADRRAEEAFALYRELLGRPPASAGGESHGRVLSAFAAALAGADRHEEVLALYWEQLRRRPRDRALYERFLGYLARHRLFEGELKVYERALGEFRDASWAHRLARWYLKHKRRKALEELMGRVAGQIDGPSLARFLGEFGRLQEDRGVGDPDNRLTLALHRAALERHPHEIEFIERLENFYRSRRMDAELLALLGRHRLQSEALAERHVAELSRLGKLDGAIREARAAGPSSLAHRRFLADALEWECRFEEALPEVAGLLEKFPSDRRLVERFASLTRSLGKRADARDALTRAAALWPGDSALETLRGEIAIEAGDAAAARECWDRLIRTRPGDPARYLEAATVFWDYFDHGRAAELLTEARRVTGEPDLHAVRLAAVHESAADFEKAIDEYIRVLWRVDLYDMEARRRLVWLSRARKLGGRIMARFRQLADEQPDDPRILTACAEWLDLLEDPEAKARLYLDYAGKVRDLELLESMAGFFDGRGDGSASGLMLGRLVEASGDEREYRLRLSAFHEARRETARAAAALERGVEAARRAMAQGDRPEACIEALLDLAAFHERGKSAEPMFAALSEADTLAAGQARREIRRRRARLLTAAGRSSEARALLEGLLAEEPLDPELFAQLADLALAARDAAGLAQLYEGGIAAVRKSALGLPDRKSLIGRMRDDLAARLATLGKFTEALDQRMEVLDRDPLESGALGRAYELAAPRGLLPRLEGHYQTVAAKSFKDHRWNVVLARLFTLEGRLDAAVLEWGKAIANEPHQFELHRARTEALVKLGRYREAADGYRDLYRLDNRDSGWLEQVALMFARAGDLGRAREELAAFVAKGERDSRAHLAAARVHARWGQGAEACREAVQAIALEQGATRTREMARDVIAGSLEILTRWGPALDALDTALSTRSRLLARRQAAGVSHVESTRLSSAARAIEAILGDSFAAAIRRYCSGVAVAALARRSTEAARGDPALLGPLGRMAAAARLPELELALLEVAAEAPWPARGPALEAVRAFHQRRGDRAAEAEIIATGLLPSATGPRKAWLLLRLASLAHLDGDATRELDRLRELIEYNHSGSTYHRGTAVEAAYLEGLRRAGAADELARAASAPSLFRIDWFVRAGLREQAIAAIRATRRDPAWQDSKELIVRLGGGESGPAVEALFERLLGPRSIASALGARPDSTRTLLGRPWFAVARQRAEYARRTGDFPQAEAYLAAAAEQHPLDAGRQVSIGEWALENRLLDVAAVRFRAAIELDPGRFLAALGLARSVAAAGKASEAAALFREAAARKSTSPAELLSLAAAMRGAGLAAAGRSLVETFTLERHRGLSLAEIVDLAREHRAAVPRDDFSLTEPFVSKLADADPARIELLDAIVAAPLTGDSHVAAYLRRAVAAVSGGAFPDRRVVSERRVRLASHLATRGETDSAAREVEAALVEDPASDGARMLKLRFLSRGVDPAPASAWLEKLVEGRVADTELTLRLAKLLAEEGRGERALALLDRHYSVRLAADPESGDAALGLAGAALQGGQWSRAVEVLQETALRRAEDEGFLAAAADLLALHGRPADAIPYRERLRARELSNHANGARLAELFFASGRRPEAVELARAILFGPGVALETGEAALSVYARALTSGAASVTAELASLRSAPRRVAASLRAEAALLGAAGDEAGCLAALERGLAQPADTLEFHRELGRHLMERGRHDAALPHLTAWFRLSGEAASRMALFRALAATKKHEEALSIVTPPGCRTQDPYLESGDEPGGEPAALAAELTRLAPPTYPRPGLFAADAAACLAAVGRDGALASICRAAAELEREPGERVGWLKRAAEAAGRAKAAAAKRPLVTEGMEE